MVKDKILIYGVGGYMGQLFTKTAQQSNLPIVFASRTEVKGINPIRIFALTNMEMIKKNLTDVKLVINLAGPFVNTAKPLIEACIATGTHYIDIAGEVPEFELAYSFNKAAKEAGVMLMPGAGFGVVPTDIAASLVKQKLPSATELKIMYATFGGASRGTLKTVLKDINKPGVKVINGKRVKAMPAESAESMTIDGKKHRVVYNPWRADLFTAAISTGIPNIATYSNFPSFIESMMKGKYLGLRNFIINHLLGLLPLGPSKKQLTKGKTYVFVEANNIEGKVEHVSIVGPEAYLFTVQTLVAITKRIIDNNFVSGFQTPSIYGKSLILEIPTVTIR